MLLIGPKGTLQPRCQQTDTSDRQAVPALFTQVPRIAPTNDLCLVLRVRLKLYVQAPSGSLPVRHCWRIWDQTQVTVCPEFFRRGF